MPQYLAWSALARRKKSVRLLALIEVPFLLVAAMAISVASGGAASAAAACQAIASGSTTGSTPVTGTVGAVGALSPLQVERYWVGAGGPLSGAVTAAALASAESDDITDRLQGSLVSAPTVPTAATPSNPSLIGWGLWQITPGSAADYNPAVNARIAVQKYEGSLAAGGGGWSPWTTYGTSGYYAAIPAAQAAYAQLTTQGGGGAAPAPTGTTNHANANAIPVAAATSATGGATHRSGSGGDADVATSRLTPHQQAEIDNEAAAMQSSGASSQCPNVSVSGSLPTVPGQVATIQPSGLAAAPTGLPSAVATVIDKLITAGNQIHTLPYIWGGGHGVPLDELQAGYDCSGSTSYILYKAGLLSGEALVSSDFEHWGQPGPGKYVTIFSNSGHVFIEVDRIVLNTAWYAPVAPTSPSSGPRWQPASTIQAQINGDTYGGFTQTHPAGL